MFNRKRQRTVIPRHLKRLFIKRILRRGFNRKQAHVLTNWFNEWADKNPQEFKNNIGERDKEALEAKINEINDKFFDWCEENKTLDPRIWGDK